jgi:hypothetical protein
MDGFVNCAPDSRPEMPKNHGHALLVYGVDAAHNSQDILHGVRSPCPGPRHIVQA